jgi:hypothetical protein
MHSKKKEENNSKKKEVQIKKFFQNIKCIIEDWLEHFVMSFNLILINIFPSNIKKF